MSSDEEKSNFLASHFFPIFSIIFFGLFGYSLFNSGPDPDSAYCNNWVKDEDDGYLCTDESGVAHLGDSSYYRNGLYMGKDGYYYPDKYTAMSMINNSSSISSGFGKGSIGG